MAYNYQVQPISAKQMMNSDAPSDHFLWYTGEGTPCARHVSTCSDCARSLNADHNKILPPFTMSNSGLSQRLAKFKSDFTRVLGPKRHGYNEVGLEQPLVGSHTLSDDDYYQQHGVSRPGGQGRPATQGQYQGPQDHSFADSAGAAQPYAGRNSAAIPDEVHFNVPGVQPRVPVAKANTSHHHLGLSQPSCH